MLETIPSREDILKVLRDCNFITKTISIKKLNAKLKVSKNSYQGFEKRLKAMCRDGQVIYANDEIKLNNLPTGPYGASSNFVTGKVQGHKDGFGFLIRDDGAADIYLSEFEMQKLMHNDKVQAKLCGQDKRGRLQGQVIEVLSRSANQVVGCLHKENGVLLLTPEDRRISGEIIIPKALIPIELKAQVKPGQIVNAQITKFPDRYSKAEAKVIEVLGNFDDSGIEIEIAVRKFHLPNKFSAAALKEAENLPISVKEKDCLGRIDLRDIPLITIDGIDARDFDDAVYCEPISIATTTTSDWRLLVAIADVAHYVPANQPLDFDAIERATSVYFPRRVLPMLPEKISNGLCSLNPKVDRLCIVCDMVVNSIGEITAYQFYEAVMHSAARCTYDEVSQILNKLDNQVKLDVKNQRKLANNSAKQKLEGCLKNLSSLYKIFAQARCIRGAIDFDTTESKMICDDAGKISQILPSKRNVAHKIIEECMLAANVCAANLLLEHKHPALYRVHAPPTVDKLNNLRLFLRSLGLTLEKKGFAHNEHTSIYANFLKTIVDRPDKNLLQTMMLRSLQQAVYSCENIGHFGLAYQAYTHFTSPIRRYPDLLVHRAIKSLLRGTKYQPQLPLENSDKNQISAFPAITQNENSVWHQLGAHCSTSERRADEASKDVEAWLKCYFMRDKLGNTYSGIITGVTNFGLFIQLEDLYIEGLLHISQLGGDYFEYDEIRNQLTGQRTNKSYRLTERLSVLVSRVDLEDRKIDFALSS